MGGIILEALNPSGGINFSEDRMIQGFFGDYRWLSNFWYARIRLIPFQSPVIGYMFEAPTNEHAYQAMKCTHHGDFLRIIAADTPAKAKRLGKSIVIRDDWDEIKVAVMYQINRAKYTQHTYLRNKLVATEGLLEETNQWGDTYWGVCNGIGENHLGKILMRLREELR